MLAYVWLFIYLYKGGGLYANNFVLFLSRTIQTCARYVCVRVHSLIGRTGRSWRLCAGSSPAGLSRLSIGGSDLEHIFGAKVYFIVIVLLRCYCVVYPSTLGSVAKLVDAADLGSVFWGFKSLPNHLFTCFSWKSYINIFWWNPPRPTSGGIV
jgi:hypothetical protein